MHTMTDATAPALTDRQKRVLTLLAGGHTTDEICRQLRLSRRAITLEILHARVRLGAANRTSAVAYAMHHGLIQVPAAR